MRTNRMGILGHYYGGMLDVYTDVTKQSAVFGTHFEILEMCELKKYRDEATDAEVQAKIQEFNNSFEVAPECELYEIERAAKTSVALDKLIEKRNLGSMAYYYEGESGNDYESIVTSVIAGNTLLTGRNIPVAGECEVKNAQAMKIMAEFGAGGSFSEFYLMDFKDDVVMLGHDGPAHFAIAEGRVKLVPLPIYHGKPGKGLSIQMTVKHGPVTLLSVVEGKDGVFLLVAEGESVPGPVLEIDIRVAAINIGQRRVEFVADPQVERQFPAHFPIVLEERREQRRPHVHACGTHLALRAGRVAQHVVGEFVAREACVAGHARRRTPAPTVRGDGRRDRLVQLWPGRGRRLGPPWPGGACRCARPGRDQDPRGPRSA